MKGRGCLLGVALFGACTPTPGNPTPTTDDGAVQVTLLHINDVYEITPIDGGRVGGLARVATVLQRLKAANPNTRMTLGGDFVSPAAVGTARVNGERLAGRQMIAVLNAAALDLTTFGNHEFDISEAQLALRISESRFGWLSSNVTDSLNRPLLGVPRHLILRFSDARGRSARIAVVGATIDQVRKPNLRYLAPVAALRQELALLKDSADAFVALPGGLGTLEEIFEVWTWGQLGIHKKPCGFLDVNGYYAPLLGFLDGAVERGLVRREHRAMAIVDDDCETLLRRLAEYEPPRVAKWIEPDET